jgi:hypothetical protein
MYVDNMYYYLDCILLHITYYIVYILYIYICLRRQGAGGRRKENDREWIILKNFEYIVLEDDIQKLTESCWVIGVVERGKGEK